MPATITTTVLNKTFNRKTDFMGALGTALVNAGFSNTNLDSYDINDSNGISFNGAGSYWNSGGPGSLVGIVKTVTLSGATQGTIQMNFFARTAYGSNWGGATSLSASTELAFHAGSFAVSGGWNTSTKVPTSGTAGNAIGGYISDYSGCLTQSTGSSANTCFYIANTGTSGGRFPLGHQYNGYSTTSDNTNFPYSFSSPVFFTAINHSEVRGVFVNQQNRPTTFLGYIRPSTLPTWWNENNHPYVFQPFNTDMMTYRGFYGSLTPFSGQTIYSNYMIGRPGAWSASSSGLPTGPLLGSANTGNSSKRDVMSSPFLLDATGIVGRFSSEIVLVNYSGLQQFDKIIVTAGVEEYQVLTPYRSSRYNTAGDSTYATLTDNSVYGLAIRTV
jgi:hypothetical protein